VLEGIDHGSNVRPVSDDNPRPHFIRQALIGVSMLGQQLLNETVDLLCASSDINPDPEWSKRRLHPIFHEASESFMRRTFLYPKLPCLFYVAHFTFNTESLIRMSSGRISTMSAISAGTEIMPPFLV